MVRRARRAERRSGLPAPAPPSGRPRYRDAWRTVVIGCAASLAAFGLVDAAVQTASAVGARWLPWAVLALGLAATSHAALNLVTALARAAQHEDLAEETARALDTSRRRSRAVLDRVGDAVFVTDASGRIIEWNSAAERVLDRDARDAVGRRCDEILALRSSSGRRDCSSGCALIGPTDTEAIGLEVFRDRGPDDVQPLHAHIARISSSDGHPAGVVHSLRDITSLRQADAAKSTFLATASHELRTPLAVIQGFAETLASHDLAPELEATALDAIQRRTRELTGVVDRILLASRLERGAALPDPELVDVAELVARCVDEFAQSGRRTVHVERPGDAVEAWAASASLGTVIDHLLDNAAKYSPPTEPIEVRVEADGEAVAITVTDHGIGMDEEGLLRCFDRFWRAEQTDVRRFGGTGIGLYLVRSFVEGMSGSVSVASAPGEGSSFVVRLRRGPPTAPDDGAHRIVRTAPRGGSLVDDVRRHAGIEDLP